MRTALLSLHSHSDRSFLDDRDVAVLSGELRQDGFENDLVVVVLDERRGETAGVPNEQVLDRLTERLRAYDVIAYQRMWSAALARELRARLAGKTFALIEGEHPVSEPAVDWVVSSLRALLEWLPAREGPPPPGVAEPSARASVPRVRPSGPPRPFAPNLAPIVVNAEALPAFRPFTVLGTEGCPYQADARDNPIYAGVDIPEAHGRGCAFCTAGNTYEARASGDVRASVLEQLQYLAEHAPDRHHFVLKDQNPFGYLTELVEACLRLGLRPFTLLIESRADWFLKNERRFARALAVAREAGHRLAPYLVGVESFSQRELDRFNKGITVETNERFIATLRAWKAEHGDALDLGHASFGFVLFTPWTTLADLRVNYEGLKRTRFDELRGKLLLSRARLYPDNALYHLAARDGLFAAEFASPDEDNALRFGYLPAQPWRFASPEVARFSEIATTLSEESENRDELALFAALLEAFEQGHSNGVTADDVRARLRAHRAAVRSRASEQQIRLFEKDAVEDRVLGRSAVDAPPRPFAGIARELESAAGAHRIIVTGGRPGRRRELREILALAREAAADRLALETDGAGLSEDVLALCAEVGVDELFVHVASLREEAHAALIGGGDVKGCLEGVVRACESGLATYAVVPVARANGKGVLSLVEWLCRLPVRPRGVLLSWPDPSQLVPTDRTKVLPPRVLSKLAAGVFDKCRARSLEHGFRSRRGISACAADGALDRYGTVFHDRQMFFKRSDGRELTRVSACATCSLAGSCKGIERSMAALFGETGLAPIPLEVSMDWKLRDLNQLGRRDYKHVSPFANKGGGDARGLLRVNGHCNMSCAFCFVNRTVPDFATDGLVEDIDRMIAAGTRHVVLSGGEPTLHPDLPRLIRHAKERGALTIEIQTNGVRAAGREYAAELALAGLNKATVSLHSADPETSNRITRLPHAFDKTVRALHNFRELGVETQVAHVITKANYEALPEMMRFLAKELPSSEAPLSVCLAIAQGISDLVYSWVVPSFSEIRPYVREALDFCLENDIGFGGMIGQGGYPPCMLDGKLEYYRRVYEHLYISDDWRDQFHKAPRCSECAFDAHCLGVRKSYVECYGDEELVPFAAPASALPRALPLAAAPPKDLVTLRVGRNA